LPFKNQIDHHHACHQLTTVTDRLIIQLHVQLHDIVAVTNEEVEELIEEGILKHKCEFCNAGFSTKSGLKTHISRWCGEAERDVYPDEYIYVIERILDARGPPKE